MLDYHLHLWSHADSSVWYRLDQIADYCEKAAAEGVTELALTEHAHRFVDVMNVTGSFWDRAGHEPLDQAMNEYFDFHARNSLDDYVELAVRAKEEGLPVKVGLEVDYVRGSMEALSELYNQYPFDVLIGSVHWLDNWTFDYLENEPSMAEWRVRDVEDVWDEYTEAVVELAEARCVDVLAHPDVIKVAGYLPGNPREHWERMTAAAAAVDVSLECNSAGWLKACSEQYPAEGFLDLAVEAGLTFTTSSDAHRLDRVSNRVGDLATLLKNRGVTELASYDARQRVMTPVGG